MNSDRGAAGRVGTELEERTLKLAVQVVGYAQGLGADEVSRVVGRQLLRSGTSIGANYREANRAESRDDFAHKAALAVKEAAETEYWLLLCDRVRLGESVSRLALLAETGELIAILTTILRRARRQ
ncbi:MAG: four helix bundle protein [Verrucomicrobia bacterium]|nr:four helix bundle protein [Verrucomicrobiota bacterium]